MLSGFSSLLFARFCAAQEADERGQLAFRMGDKYEMYVAEKKLPTAVMRKYTYIIEGREAGGVTRDSGARTPGPGVRPRGLWGYPQ